MVLEHRTMVADIVDIFIVGLDAMRKFRFVLAMKNRVVTVGYEEVIPSHRLGMRNFLKLMLTTIVQILLNIEQIVTANMERDSGGSRNGSTETLIIKNSSVMVGRCLVDADKPVPVRVTNLNYHKVTLKEEDVYVL